MFDDADGWAGLEDEDVVAVRARLGLTLPEDGGPPRELVERLLQLSDYARLASLSSAELVETVVAFAAIEAWAAAGSRAAAARLHESLAWDGRGPVPTSADRAPGRVDVPGAAADELAMRLGVSRRRAGMLVGEGRAYEGVLHPVGTALAAGSIDAGKAAAFAELLVDQSPPVCFAVCEQVLPAAPGLPHHVLRQRLRSAIIHVDPTTAHERAVVAARTRRLERPHLLADGLASLRLVAPLLDVATVYSAAEAAARAQRASGDPRTLDQLRADALTTLAADALTRGTLVGAVGAVGAEDAVRGAAAGAVSAEDDDTAVLAVRELDEFDLMRLADEARLNATTPRALVERTAREALRSLPPSSRRRRSAGGVQGRLPSVASQMLRTGDDTPGAGASGPVSQSGSSPSGTPEAGPSDLASAEGDAAQFLPFVPFSGTTSRLTLAAAPEHLTPPDPSVTHPAHLWAWDIDHATGVDDAGNPYAAYEAPTTCRPGVDVPEILGFGPVEPTVARRAAGDAPRFLRISTLPADIVARAGRSEVTSTGTGTGTATATTTRADDVDDAGAATGRSLGAGTLVAPAGYVPSAELARRVRTLHPVCVAPACTVPSTACDLDHVVAWPLGPTVEGNLRPLCRHHHRLKTHDGHRASIDTDGSFRWATPAGYVYLRPVANASRLVDVPTGRPAVRAARPSPREASGRLPPPRHQPHEPQHLVGDTA